jgi:hypothetical protein
MGQGEYGGNGSVHYYATHKRDRNHGNGRPHNYHEVDEFPSQPGSNFRVEVLNLQPGATFTVDANGVLRVETPILIDPDDPERYTPSVFITWPNPPDQAQGS